MKIQAAASSLLACCLLLGACSSRPPVLRPVPDAEAVGVFHVVKPGETLWGICRRFGARLQEVAEINGIEKTGQLRVGQIVFIPDVGARPAAGKEKRPGEQPAGQPIRHYPGMFTWPLEGTVTSRFGLRGRRRHDGIDIAAPAGTPIKAAAPGRVLFAGNQGTGYGNLVILHHDRGMITVYAHCRRLLVAEGQQVKRGQTIATVGSTGRSTGPHLHFEIRKRTRPRNPLFFLPRK